MSASVRSLRKRGQAMVEWMGLLLLLSLVCIAVVGRTGVDVRGIFEAVNASFGRGEQVLSTQDTGGGVGASGGASGSRGCSASGERGAGEPADALLMVTPLAWLLVRRRRLEATLELDGGFKPAAAGLPV